MSQLEGAQLPELEQRIIDRTIELEATNKELAHEIAERKRTEAELRFQAQLLDSVRESVVATDLEGRVTYWSKGAESLYGYHAEEVMGRSIASFIVGSQEEQEEERRMQTVRETGSWSGCYMQHRKDGSTFWADTFISLVTDQHGQPSGFIGIDRDVTEHQQAEEALRESEARLSLAQEAADIGTGDWDIKSDKVYWSNHQFHLHGIAPTADNMIGLEAWLALVHPDDRVTSVDVIKASVKSGKGFSAEYRVIWPDGQMRWLYGTARVIRDDNNRAVRMIGVSIDITERKQADEALRESEERFRNMIEGSIQGIMIHRDWKPLFANQAYAIMFGYESPEEVLAMDSIEPMIAPQELERLLHYKQARESGKPAPIEYEYDALRKDGSIITARNMVRMINWKGQPAIQSVVIDITESKRAEETLRRAERMVSASSDLMVFIDKSYTYLAANTAYIEAFGKTRNEVVGQRVPDVLGSEIFDSRMKSHLDRCLAGNHIKYQRWLSLPARGGARFLDVRYDPYWDFNNSVSGVVVSIRDITENKLTEEALRQSEIRYRSIVQNAPICIHEIDTSGRLISMNPAGMRMMRVKNQTEIIGMPYLDIVCTDERRRVERLLKRALAGEPAAFEFNATTKLARRAFTSSFNPIRTVDGTVEKLMGMTEDITERKRSEEQILASHQRLRNLATQLQAVREEERTIIAREVHDELGQALTALKMDLAWIAKNLPNRWKAVPNRVHSMISLTDSTLSTVRQLSSRLRPAMLDDLGLEAAIEWQLQDFTSRGNCEHQIDLRVTALKQNKKRDIAVFRIFQEALTNIARHANASRIIVKLSTKGEELLLVIKDDGKGISDDALTSAYSLGLTGMYERARTLDGSLTIERGDNDRGTVLTLSVPLTSTKRLAPAG